MLRKICNFIMFFLLLVVVPTEAARPMDRWSCTGEIQLIGDNRYKAFFLDDLVYRHAAADLSDLRITNQNGEFVPYILQNGFETGKTSEKTQYTILTKSFKRKHDLYFDFAVVQSDPNIDPLGSVLRFKLPYREFLKEIEILGSYDGKRWEYLAFDQLYSVQNLIKDEVNLAQPEKYSFYRIKVLNNPEQLEIKGLEIIDRNSVANWSDFEKETEIKYDLKQQPELTSIKINNPNRLRIKEILIKAEGNFKRTYYLAKDWNDKINDMLQTGEIYNFKFKNCDVTKTTIDLSDTPYSDTILYLKIINKDDHPLTINGITIRYYIDKVIFESQEKGTYYLYAGNPKATKPEYDLKHFQSYLEMEAQDLVKVQNYKVYPSDRVAKVNHYMQVSFNLIIVIVAALLIILVVQKLNRDPLE